MSKIEGVSLEREIYEISFFRPAKTLYLMNLAVD